MIKISDEQKIAMLTRKYNISDKFDNTVLGVFIGIISGVMIEILLNAENNCLEWLLIGFCLVAIILLLMAINTNSKFVSKCLALANGQIYRDIETIKNDVSDRRKLERSFWFCIVFSFIFFSTGIFIFKFT